MRVRDMNTNRPPIVSWIGNPIQNPNPLQARIPGPISAPIQAPLSGQLTADPSSHATVLAGAPRNAAGALHIQAILTVTQAQPMAVNTTNLTSPLRPNIGIVQEPIKTLTVNQAQPMTVNTSNLTSPLRPNIGIVQEPIKTLTVHATPGHGHQVHHISSTSQPPSGVTHHTSSTLPANPQSVAAAAASVTGAGVTPGIVGVTSSSVVGGITSATIAGTAASVTGGATTAGIVGASVGPTATTAGVPTLAISHQSQQQQQQFQRLKVEDALSYLDQVKFKFNYQPQVYNDFLDIMKEFKSQSIDTPGVIQRVSNLFRGHPELIVGFNTFLPPGYKIEMQSNDQVNVSMPSSTSILIIHNSNANTVTTNPQMLHLPSSSPSQGPVHGTPHHPGAHLTTASGLPGQIGKTVYSSPSSATPYLQTQQQHNQTITLSSRSVPSAVEPHPTTITHGPPPSSSVASQLTSASINSSLGSIAPTTALTTINIPSSSGSVGALGTGPGPGPSLDPSSGSVGAGGPNSGSNSTSTCVTGPGGDNNATSAQPVEFNHAINYVNKIKNRFQGQPEVYKQFLEILHAYQKEQKCLKEGIKPDSKPLNESQVYAQVAKLFQNQEDLLQEFGQFLPDANAAAISASNSVFTGVSQSGVNSGLHHGSSHHGPSTGGSSISTAISAAHHVDNLAAAHRAATNDHGAIVKSSLARPGAVLGSSINASSGIQIKRQATNIQSSPSINKPKMTSLRDVSLAEAGKYGSLNEYAFFDKVRKALRSQEVYDNFLRCLFLYNHEIVSRNELVLLVTPFLGKFPELLKYFKDFLGYKDGNSNSNSYSNFSMSSTNNNNNMFMEGLPQRVVGIRERDRERLNQEGSGMEIDYATCKRYGASYRALPKNYLQPECSGRTPLCKEVLNDTWVSFPSWSEDSTFVTSRKTQYEEFIYRCEDERFELDVVIETNLSTIRVLEAVQKRLSRMTPEERAKFRLDDCLGGTSAIIHQRSIRRIYGDKASEIIEGLKKNPSIAVPLVLRRLKNKEEEWKEAQKQFNKIWREQSEKYYLKSLDHQGISFKQNDVKYLRSKSLLNEIETFYEERHEQNEENMAAAGEGTGNNNNNNGQSVASGPHMTLAYKNKEMIEEACNLIIHHVKRQTSIHKEDKQKIKQLLKHFIPDLFATQRGELSDDELEDFEIEKKTDDSMINKSKDGSNTSTVCFPVVISNVADGKVKCDGPNGNCTGPNNLIGDPNSLINGNSANGHAKIVNPMLNSDPDDNYALFFVNNYWYLFFRLHHILCDRLAQMHERAMILIAEEEKEKTLRKESTAAALRLKPKNDYEVEEYFPALIDMVKQVLDGNLDFNQFEDQLREMFGIHAYIAFTMDKVVQNIVRQLQHIVCDETCIQCTEMFIEESKNAATGGPCATHHLRSNTESIYQKKAEQLLNDENCFKIIIYKGEGKVTIELIVTDSVESEDGGEVEKWSEYVEKYVKEVENEISDELKERLSKKPVFLPRNIRMWRYKAKEKEEKANEHRGVSGVGDNSSSLQVVDDTQCKFNVNSYKMVFVVQSESYLCKRNALAKARKTHRNVSRKLHSKFYQFHQNWVEKEVSSEQKMDAEEWFMGNIYEEIEEEEDIIMKDEETQDAPTPDETIGNNNNNSENKLKSESQESSSSAASASILSTTTTITSKTGTTTTITLAPTEPSTVPSTTLTTTEMKPINVKPKMKTRRVFFDNPNKSPYRPFCKYSTL